MISKARRRSILERDGYRCRGCGREGNERSLHVHHIKPERAFAPGEYKHHVENLVTHCPSCHGKAEKASRENYGPEIAEQQERKRQAGIELFRRLDALYFLARSGNRGAFDELVSELCVEACKAGFPWAPPGHEDRRWRIPA